MLSHRKGISGHIIVILVISFFMASLLYLILETVLVEDPIGCEEVEYAIKSCFDVNNNKVSLSIKNLGENNLRFQLNDVSNSNFLVESNSVKVFNVSSGNQYMIFTPLFNGENQLAACKKKRKTYDLFSIKEC